jgi:hypothetical protein
MKIFYFSISANPWQRAALFDSAIESAKNKENQITFFQSYAWESTSVDLPISSYLDYKVAKIQDMRMSQKLRDRDLVLEQYSLIDSTLKFDLDEVDLKIGYEETIVKTRDSKPCRQHSDKLIQHFAHVHHSAYSQAITFLLLRKPDLIYIFNGRFYREKAIWRAALKLGIEVIFIERFSPGWEDRYFEFKKPVHNIEYRCSLMQEYWEKYCEEYGKEKAIEVSTDWFIGRSQGTNQSFTKDQILPFERGSEVKTLVTFFHSSEDELFTTDLGSVIWNDQIEFIKELSEMILVNKSIHLIVRLHPNLRYKSVREITRWRDFSSNINLSNVTFLMHDSAVKTYDLLQNSDLVLTFGSTIGVEASFIKKPSLLVSRAFHELLDVVQVIQGKSDLEVFLTEAVPNKVLEKYAYNTHTYGLFHATAGNKFRNLVRRADRVQDPSFCFGKYKIGSWKLISLIRRLEGLVRSTFWTRLDLTCSCPNNM